MVLPSAGLRLYIRYKAHSCDLFTDILAKARDFRRELHPDHGDLLGSPNWSSHAAHQYEEFINTGFVRNLICYGARKKFRDLYVPVETRDAAHEKAIQNAEENCATYANLYADL